MTTKDKIKCEVLKLLEKYPADDVTLKLFCMESGLSKQTLYNHYYSLMDALDDAYKSAFTEKISSCNDYRNWVEGFYTYLEFLKERREICMHLYNSSRKDDFISMIGKYGMSLVRRGIEECSADMGIEVSDKDKDFMMHFYMHVFMGITSDYFRDKMREDPAYIAGRCDAMLRYHIRNTLKNIRQIEEGSFN